MYHLIYYCHAWETARAAWRACQRFVSQTMDNTNDIRVEVIFFCTIAKTRFKKVQGANIILLKYIVWLQLAQLF